MLSQVSSFKDLEEAEYFVAMTMHHNYEKIQEWLKKTKTRLESFESLFPNPTGTLVNDRGKPEAPALDVYGVRVVLAPAKNTERYMVKTAYPIEFYDVSVCNRYPMLGCLFGAYFNQDWDLDNASPGAVISKFVDDASKKEILIAIDELRALLKEKHSQEDWYHLLSVDLGCAYSLRREGLDAVGWLERIFEQLKYRSSIIKGFLKKFNVSVDIAPSYIR